MARLVLDEPKVVLDVVEPGQVGVPEHVRVQLADSGFLVELLRSVRFPGFVCKLICKRRSRLAVSLYSVHI
jgi:hypothetical protein